MTFKRVTSHPFEAIHTIHLLLLSLSFHLTLSLDIPYSSLLSPPYQTPLSISSSSACFQATSFRISFGLDQLQSIHPLDRLPPPPFRNVPQRSWLLTPPFATAIVVIISRFHTSRLALDAHHTASSSESWTETSKSNQQSGTRRQTRAARRF